MSDEATFDTIAVSTGDSRNAILAANNSAAWTLNIQKWGDRLRYLVCLKKVGTKRQAFLVCKISAIRLRSDQNDVRPRFSIEFDEYADAPANTELINGTQYPVRFGRLSAFKINDEKLDFRKAQPKTLDYSYSTRTEPHRQETGISIAEAKRRLAFGLGVREDQIDIIVRA